METIGPYLDKLIELVANASPAIWEAALRQTIVTALTNLAWAAFLLFAGVPGTSLFLRFCLAKYRAARKRDPWAGDDWIAGGICSACFLVLAVGLALGFATDGAKMLANPNWYAMKQLLGLVGVRN